MKISFNNLFQFSKLAKQITSVGTKNYKGGKVDGYITQKTKSSKKSVIIIHEWWGLNKSICDTADHFANIGGFRVIVPDLYKRNPAGDAEEAGHFMNTLDWDRAIEDIESLQKELKRDSERVSIMGFCMGGALTLASASKINGWHSASPFYGIPDLNKYKLSNIKCPVLAHFGGDDNMMGFSDPQSAKKLQQSGKKYGVSITINIWPKVGHAFCNQNSDNFNSNTRDSAFEITSKFFLK